LKRRTPHDAPLADAPADTPADPPSGTKTHRGPSRRALLRTVGIGAIGVGIGASAGPVWRAATSSPQPARVAFPQAGELRIDDVTVVDPADGSATPGRSVLLRGGRVLVVGAVGEVPSGPGARVLDGAGRYAVPGYVNMHSHALQAERPELFLAAMLAEGTTGFRQMLGTTELLRNRAEGRLPLTPHAPGLLSMPGDLILPFNARSPRGARDEIARQWDQGADFVKMVMVERDVFFAAVEAAHDRGLRIAGHLPPSVGVAEAAEAGFDCLEHLGTGNAVFIACSTDEDALWAEQDKGMPIPGWVTGLPFIDDVFSHVTDKQLINPAAFGKPAAVALLQRALDAFDEGKARALARTLAASGTWQSPTLVRLRTQYLADAPEYATDPWLGRMSSGARAGYEEVLGTFRALPPEMLATYRQAYARSLDIVRIMHEEGVPVLAATDGQGRVPGQWLQLELQELAAAGFSPLEVLRSATVHPAAYLGRADSAGRLVPGADADLLLLDSDPLTDVAHLGDIAWVVRAGHPLAADELAATVERLATEEPSASATAALASARRSADACCAV
jgi:imidazolonepropionase-like amidohydrolase